MLRMASCGAHLSRRPTMAQFEQAVLQALGTLPAGCWQRVDGLMTEMIVLRLYPTWFAPLRLWLLERRGLVESCWTGSFWPSCNGMKSYRLGSHYRLRAVGQHVGTKEEG